jgi:uncharacterized protein YkwD
MGLLNHLQKAFLISLIIGSSVLLCHAQNVPVKTGSKMDRIEAQDALDFHNKVRKDVSAPALEWSVELATYAQEWAEYLSAKNNCQMAHRKSLGKNSKNTGENIFWGSASSFSAKDASESWYSEIQDYVYRAVSVANYHKTGHYTQMVWKNTKQVGIGVSICKDGGIIIVANYFPPGNYIGEKPY